MKIIKSTETKKENCSAVMCMKKDEEKEPMGKMEKFLSYMGEKKRRALIIGCSALLIGGAIFLNVRMFGTTAEAGTVPKNTNEPVSAGTDIPVSNTDDSAETYFALAVIERARARDEAIGVLQNVVDSSDVGDNEKISAVDSLSEIAGNIEAEANIETWLKAKGFDDCLAVIDGKSARIIIGTDDSLMANEIAQITEAVYSCAGILPTDLIITEKKNGK